MKKIQQYFNKVMAELNAYKTVVDAFIPQYQAEVKKHEAFLTGMKGKYTEQYIEQQRAAWKPKTNNRFSVVLRHKYGIPGLCRRW